MMTIGLLVVGGLAIVGALVGLVLGIFVLAPAIWRALHRATDEETVDTTE